MLARGSGTCVFVNSAASRLVWPGAAAYTASRWAQAAIPVLSVDQAAAAILQGLKSDREEVVEPLMLRLVLSWAHFFPAVGRKMMLQPTRSKAQEGSISARQD
jgi:short-subunit dehydrogenase